MKWIKSFNEFKVFESTPYFDKSWEKIIPNNLNLIYGDKNEPKHLSLVKKDTMINYDLCQLTWYQEVWGQPDYLSMDIYFTKVETKIKSTINITYGDSMMSEFSFTSQDDLKITKYESFNSKYDPNTMFAFDDDSIEQLASFFNKFNGGMNFNKEHLTFLDKYEDSYTHENNI